VKTERERRLSAFQIALGIFGFLIFVIALGFMKEGARGLAPLVRGHLDLSHAADSLGFGWLMAYLVLSGSPIAAAAVALLSAEAITSAQTFTMIAGSRLGACLIVLLVGFIYSLRGHEQRTALSAGVLSLLLVASVQLIAVPMGLLLLNHRWLSNVQLPALARMGDLMNSGLDPLVDYLANSLPDWAVFVAGVGMVTISFRCFDRALPQVKLKQTDLDQIPRLVYRPEVMFLLGLAITALTLSVSISISILVPLSARGYMRRENIIPYILGANISTLVDTLVAAMLVGDPRAVTVVLTHMVCAAIVSLLFIGLAYRFYERLISGLLARITRRRRNFLLFLSIIFAIPIVLILL